MGQMLNRRGKEEPSWYVSPNCSCIFRGSSVSLSMSTLMETALLGTILSTVKGAVKPVLSESKSAILLLSW